MKVIKASCERSNPVEAFQRSGNVEAEVLREGSNLCLGEVQQDSFSLILPDP
jgi:hypothetical protein